MNDLPAREGGLFDLMTEETQIFYNACGMNGETAWAVPSLDGTEDYANGKALTFSKALTAAKQAQSDHSMRTRRNK
jgi:hypothetical protein